MYVTLNISATSLRLLSVKGRQVQKWASVPLEPGMVKDGFISDPKAVGTAIDALFKSAKASRKRVIVSLTALPFTYRILSLPPMKPELMEEAIQRGARKEIPLPLEDLYLSWQAIGSGDDELDIFVLGVPRNVIDAVVQALAKAGVTPYLMELKPLALARAASQGDALIVALEPDCFDIVLVANGIPAIMHTITPRGKGATLEDNIRRLTDDLSRTVEFYNSSHPETPLNPTTPLLLTGELAAETATSELIEAEVEYPVEPLVAPLKFPPDLPTALYAANMGLALKKAPGKAVAKGDVTPFHDINLNILSAKYETKTRRIPIRHILVPLALVIAAIPLSPLYQLRSEAYAETTRLQIESNGVSQELNQARLVIDEAKQVEDSINAIVADAEALEQEHQDILAGGDDLAYNLDLVTKAIPSEAYFTSIEIDADQISVDGEADSYLTVVSYVNALEAQLKFPEIRIAEIDESKTTEEDNSGISFTVVISK